MVVYVWVGGWKNWILVGEKGSRRPLRSREGGRPDRGKMGRSQISTIGEY